MWLNGYGAMQLHDPGGYYRFQVTGMIEGFFWGVEIFDIGNFGGKKILATCFATVFVFWKFLWLGNSA